MPLGIDKPTKYVASDRPLCPHCDEYVDVFVPELNHLFTPGTHSVTCNHCQHDIQVHSEPVYWFYTDRQDVQSEHIKAA